MHSIPPGAGAVVIGSSGGIGAALVDGLRDDPTFEVVVGLSRDGGCPDRSGRLRHGRIDVGEPDSIVQAAAGLRDIGVPIRLLIVATGLLHAPGLQPEKTIRAVDAEALLLSYRINAVGPALVARYMLPLLAPAGRSVFGVLSARVGSIGDNRSGGWHAYRASKAALNMILRDIAIEMRRRMPDLVAVGLHPGTVDSDLSRPFQRGVVEGRLFTPQFAAGRLLSVIDGLEPPDSGNVLDWQGLTIPP